jgi:hypothetical protein
VHDDGKVDLASRRRRALCDELRFDSPSACNRRGKEKHKEDEEPAEHSLR